MRKSCLVVGLLLFATSFAGAQEKISGVVHCLPLNPSYQIPVGDHEGHTYGLAQGTCTWTKPWEIAGVKNTQGVGTQKQETTGNTTKVRGVYVDTMANGDKAFYNFGFSLVTKKDGQHVMNHKWELVGGTGKLKGVKGKGTCTAKPSGSDGSFDYDCQGEYTLAKP